MLLEMHIQFAVYVSEKTQFKSYFCFQSARYPSSIKQQQFHFVGQFNSRANIFFYMVANLSQVDVNQILLYSWS